MDLLQSLEGMLVQNITGAGQGGRSSAASRGAGLPGLDGLSGLLGPAALGSLAGALLGGKARSAAGGAILASGGAYLWNKYKDQLTGAFNQIAGGAAQQQSGGDDYFGLNGADAAQAPAAPDQSQLDACSAHARRLLRAMVFAAKADGNVDAQEEAAITSKLADLNLGSEAQQIVNEAMRQTLDPQIIAEGVTDPAEAAQLFIASCSVINVDNFMERAYLDGLAQALRIPADMKDEVLSKLQAARG